jgi:hypothetical protein
MQVTLEQVVNDPQACVDFLTYCNYAHNRELSPGVSPEQWEKVYGPNTKEMERRYQAEKAAR